METAINAVLTETAKRLLNILQRGGEKWQTRREIAEQISPERTRLYRDEDEALESLLVNKLIETTEERRGQMIASLYRTKQNG